LPLLKFQPSYIIATKFYKLSATKMYNSREVTFISVSW